MGITGEKNDLPKPTIRESPLAIHSTRTKTNFWAWRNEETTENSEGSKHIKHQLCDKMKDVCEPWDGHAFSSIYLPHRSKTRFPKNDVFSNSNLTAILFPSQGINYLNQFLEEINDWAQKTKWVVDNFMGFPFDIGFTPLAQGFDYFPLPIPCEIMPSSL